MSDILSSPCWIKATDFANPAFRRAYDYFVDERDQFGGYLMRQALHISADDFRTAVISPDEMPVFSPTGSSAKTEEGNAAPAAASDFPYVMAVPFTVCPAVCDASDAGEAAAAEASPACMVEGAVTALMDMVTSFHIMLAAFPQTNGHVSLSIQANHMAKMECGKSYVAISRIDKMGRRIVYTSVDFVEPQLQPVRNAQDAPLPMRSTAELLAALKTASVCANVKHVKSMLSFS